MVTIDQSINQPHDPRAGLNKSVENLTFIRLLQKGHRRINGGNSETKIDIVMGPKMTTLAKYLHKKPILD